ncbi:uncharacterized protein LOC125525187 [Triticum urartu]|uniref:Plant-specific domain TIGR01615 family protein n=1 Tax=Triticum urartu TaxID=4572 RepID=A0A8R7P6K2_TRIUA|nr:uncharacterized protein LOC125525187 [Triticum urartu]
MVVAEAGDERSLSNMVLGFYEEADRERRPEDETTVGDGGCSDDERAGGGAAAESSAFWAEQLSHLHEVLGKTSSAESRIRADTEEAVRHARSGTATAAAGVCSSCATRATAGGGCRGCTLRSVAARLRDAGYDSAVCRSRWARSAEFPAGEHSYVDVVVPTRSGRAVRVVVEPSFRAEFAMARGGAGYGALVAALPEAFVGRAEKLRAVVAAMCAAAKRCARESSLHMAPWRKRRYMEAKWLGTPDRLLPAAGSPVAAGSPESEKQRRFRASMLTLDFGGRTAVEVA